jgi:hypothetical protein
MKDQSFFREEHQILPTASLPSKNLTSTFSSEAVAEAAYYIYLNQGSQQGYAVQHWEEAIRQLQAKQNIAQKTKGENTPGHGVGLFGEISGL